MPRYYYITFITPVGPGARFWRTGAGDVFLPEEYGRFTTDVARQATLSRGQIVPPEHVLLQTVIQLPDEVARARWPQDFGVDGGAQT